MALLAREVGRELHQKPVRLLRKVRHNKPQSSLQGDAQRRANVLGAYRLRDPAAVAGKRILILDDILTTGATVSECAKILVSGRCAAGSLCLPGLCQNLNFYISVGEISMKLFSRDLGVDLGTANVLIYADGKGIVLREPSVVAVDRNSGKVLQVGAAARNMMGRTPGNVVAIRPLRSGVISDYEMTERMLARLFPEGGKKGHFEAAGDCQRAQLHHRGGGARGDQRCAGSRRTAGLPD